MDAEQFEHSVILSAAGSDLRIQLQTDPRYQEFIPAAVERDVPPTLRDELKRR